MATMRTPRHQALIYGLGLVAPGSMPVGLRPSEAPFRFAGEIEGAAPHRLGTETPGLAIRLELLDTSVRQRRALEALFGVPVLSRIPPLKPYGVEGISADRAVDHLLAEESR
ncbi:hypothetical protein [Marichromatium bheemlicum]|uniref:Uncharacterized protein n=1 Tax=Marichromatium bheemlicum TaxID=365339 RepID=A0ABX1I861_9GAMM|nr:hypothetical protein [Marichromatium bheemlicum]NKN33744.1 hypothetical protein [Marichromatium bheemlicum]